MAVPTIKTRSFVPISVLLSRMAECLLFRLVSSTLGNSSQKEWAAFEIHIVLHVCVLGLKKNPVFSRWIVLKLRYLYSWGNVVVFYLGEESQNPWMRGLSRRKCQACCGSGLERQGFHQGAFENGRPWVKTWASRSNCTLTLYFFLFFFFKALGSIQRNTLIMKISNTYESRENSMMSSRVPIAQLRWSLTNDHSGFTCNFTTFCHPSTTGSFGNEPKMSLYFNYISTINMSLTYLKNIRILKT